MGKVGHRYNALILVAVGLLALGVYLWQLSVPEVLSSYDSGVYFAASFHLVDGILPYRDFVFVNPPGILLLLSPVALFSRIAGSHDGLILARIVTSLVTALNAVLLAWLVRRRGYIAMIIAGAGLALCPVALFVSSAVKLDPYCICLILCGALAALPGDNKSDRPSTSRFALAGALFGFAAVVKLWAFFPFLALVVCVTPRYRSKVLVLAGTAGGAFIIPCLPFLALAPKQFINQVFSIPLFGTVNPTTAQGIMWRLSNVTGFTDTSIAPSGRVAAIALMLLLCLFALTHRRLTLASVDAFLFISGAITIIGLLAAPNYSQYYGYFAAPFLIGALAVSVSLLVQLVRAMSLRLVVSTAIRRLVSGLAIATVAFLIFGLTLYVTTFNTNFAWANGAYGPWLAPIDKFVPFGSCVVYDHVYSGAYANRLQTDDTNCPSLVDPFALWQEWGNRLTNPPKSFVAQWKSYFEAAQYAIFISPQSSEVPWTPTLTMWFYHHYRLLYGRNSLYIYGKTSST